MARLRPMVEREAMWAAGLASLAAVSFWATLPAAVVLAVRILRRKDPPGGDGSEPAFAALALALAFLAFWFAMPGLYAIARTAVVADDPWRVIAFVSGLSALAGVALWLATYALRCHPERWVARRVTYAGLVTVIAAGGLQAVIALSRSAGFVPTCGRITSTNADCVGEIPWAVLAPAAVMGAAFLVVSLAGSALRRRVRTSALPRRPDRP